MNGYYIRKVSQDVVEINEESARWRMDERSLLEAIAALKENEEAYTDKMFYRRSLALLEDALAVLRKEA